MASSVKIPINYVEAAETLKKLLKLSGSPVAFRFATKKEEIPARYGETRQEHPALHDGRSCTKRGKDLLFHGGEPRV